MKINLICIKKYKEMLNGSSVLTIYSDKYVNFKKGRYTHEFNRIDKAGQM